MTGCFLFVNYCLVDQRMVLCGSVFVLLKVEDVLRVLGVFTFVKAQKGLALDVSLVA
jgi:hypothetical protein